MGQAYTMADVPLAGLHIPTQSRQTRASQPGYVISMTRAATLLWVLALASSAAGCESESKASKSEDAVPVLLATAELRDVPRDIKTFGSVEASSTVDVAAQVQGLVTEVHFKEGDFVKRGD